MQIQCLVENLFGMPGASTAVAAAAERLAQVAQRGAALRHCLVNVAFGYRFADADVHVLRAPRLAPPRWDRQGVGMSQPIDSVVASSCGFLLIIGEWAASVFISV